MMNDIKFYDTCSLLLKGESVFKSNEKFVISSVTLEELENIKTSSRKDADIKFAARQLVRALDRHSGEYEVAIFTEDMLIPINDMGLTINDDIRILATAIFYDTYVRPDETIFVTNDLCLKNIANLFFGEDSIMSVDENDEEDYAGYLEYIADDDILSSIYSDRTNNILGCLTNQYVILYNHGGEVIDRLCWTGNEYRQIYFDKLESVEFGKVKPMDVQQQLVADSLFHNKITMIKGKAGSGKSLLALSFLFNQLEHHKIDKIVIFCNTVAVRGAAKLGFYPGSKDEKLLDSQIGNMLASKLGDKVEVQKLIEEGRLILVPTADCRGFDTSGMNCGVYLPESQNASIDMMKLMLQRIGDDSICIIDGDYDAQTDDEAYAGSNNGMRRVSKVFRGHDIYGEVKLINIWRSEIGRIADGL